ncbi:flagellar filament capping protein FliD [Anaerosacchariphilus polymeriproducens]|uniref:Flagellar hook-associated protein 2 n=1 Tax=Anaerosacchariphilus polymeriproducens TaxID=1812858 RepID=A0A371AQQ7_9FIRM|nr:flagellar filament capping protein FliD [Anaerosacchariphilus polymeriproducens]RDU21899.1 hypothetical protein DWV06_18120 [Anaerosacchariphilus polymeriproducens]
MAIRLSGLSSGLDTDSIVTELVSAYKIKKDNYKKDQTKLEWKQDAWKELNSKIYNLYSKTVSNLRYSTAYKTKTTTLSDTTKASVTAGNNSTNGTQTLSITKLAKAGYLTGAELTGASDYTSSTKLSELGIATDTSFDITIGSSGTPKNISIGADTTIGDVVSKLKTAGVNASFDTTNQRFFISSKTSGAENDFSLSASDADGTAALESLGLTTSAVKVAGQDAEIYLNGAQYTNASNTFTVNGLTITAKEETGYNADSSRKEISINTADDTKGIYDSIKNFFKEYNVLINEMDSLYNATSAKGYQPLTDEEKETMTDDQIEKWEKKIKDSLFRRDSTLDSVSSSMKSAMMKSYTVNGKTYSLASFGISTLGYFTSSANEKNAYHIDGDSDDSATSGKEDKLMTALTTDPASVESFFTQLTTGLYDSLDAKMKSTTLSSAYTVYNDKQMKQEYDEYDDLIGKWEKKMSDMEKYYYKKFSEMETALTKLQSSTSSLASLLGS